MEALNAPQSLDTVRLEPRLPLAELGPRRLTPMAGLTHVGKRLCQLEHTQGHIHGRVQVRSGFWTFLHRQDVLLLSLASSLSGHNTRPNHRPYARSA